jgi:ribosomal protein L16 Arg81 hydroxylase
MILSRMKPEASAVPTGNRMESRLDFNRLDLGFVVNPIPSNEFLSQYLSQKYAYIRGTPGRFANLLPWTAVNSILRHQYLRTSVRLVKDGQMLPTDPYFRPNLDAPAVTALLRDGATMIISRIDDLYEPIGLLCERLGREIWAEVHANMYAGFRTNHGFDLHRDDHDVLVLQIAGKKHWQVFGETDKAPLSKDGPKPKSPPLWDGYLSDGDALYLPRGWWHVATPCNEPTLHLTVGLYNLTGHDFLRWICEPLKSNECFRIDVPRFQNYASQARYLSQIREMILNACSDPSLLDRFLREMDSRLVQRAAFAVPHSVDVNFVPSDEHIIELATSRRLSIAHLDNGQVQIDFDRQKLTFDAPTEPLLRFLNDCKAISVADFCTHFSDRYDRDEVRLLVGELARHGVVSIFEAR